MHLRDTRDNKGVDKTMEGMLRTGQWECEETMFGETRGAALVSIKISFSCK